MITLGEQKFWCISEEQKANRNERVTEVYIKL